MAESIKKRVNALADSKSRIELKKLFDAILVDLTEIRASLAGILTGSATKDFASIADGADDSVDVTVTGAVLGDQAIASIGVDVTDLIVSASVTAADTVTVAVYNGTGGAVDLAETTVRATVFPYGSFDAPSALTLTS